MGYKRKQYIGLGLTIAFMLLLLIIMIVVMNSIKGNMTEIVQDRYYKVNEITEIRQELFRVDRDLAQIMAEDADKSSAISIADSETVKRTIYERLLGLEALVNRQTAKVLINEIKTEFNTYAEMDKEIRAKQQAGASKQELKAIYHLQMANRDLLFQKLDEFKEFQEELMSDALAEARASYYQLLYSTIGVVAVALILITTVMIWAIRGTVGSLNSLTQVIREVNYNDLATIPRMPKETDDEIGKIADAYNAMAVTLERLTISNQKHLKSIKDQNWVETHVAELVQLYSQHVTTQSLAEEFIAKLTPLIGGYLGVFYGKTGIEQQGEFTRLATFGTSNVGFDQITSESGLIGEAIKGKQMLELTDVPSSFQVATTGIGTAPPKTILIVPILQKDEVVACLEMASLTDWSPSAKKLLTSVVETLGIGYSHILGRMEVERLLQESQAQAEELQVQSEELQSQSEELQAQAEELQMQTEELRITNERLEERSTDAELKTEELQVAKEALEQKARELQQSSKYKSEFLANMSHELRTPLNSILLLSEMLADEEEPLPAEEQQEFAKVIHSSGQDLLVLISDILDLSKVEAGKLDISFEEVYLTELVDRLGRNFTPVAKNKQLAYQYEMDEDVPPIIYTDEQRLQQILKNILSNAFKFTEKGSVTLRLQVPTEQELKKLRLTTETCWVKFTVTDTGIGIPSDKKEMIFEAFQQVDGAIMRKYGGTGLGLSITKEFTQLLGGKCIVESVEGAGSTFALYIPNLPEGWKETEQVQEQPEWPFPLDSGAAPTKEVIQLEEACSEDFQGRTVLLVDDDHRNIFTLKNALEKEGMTVITATNGAECLDRLAETQEIKLILMDVMMPVLDGFEAMKRIRANEEFNHIPIIALTAKAMKGDREKCLEAGANDYISKPMKWEQLLSAIRVWLA